MKWSFVRRTERGKKLPFHMQQRFGKVLLKVSYLSRRASIGTQTRIPQSDLPLIRAGFLWVSLYSIDTARDHEEAGMVTQQAWDQAKERQYYHCLLQNKQTNINWLPSPFTPTRPSLSPLLFKVKAPSTMSYWEFLISAI